MQLDSNMIESLLANSSVYDLFCINKRMSLILEDDLRIQQIKQSLQIGQLITYFNSRLNRIVSATVIEKQIKRVLVENINDRSKWWIRYYAISLDSVQTTPITKTQSGKLSKSNLSIGDMVGFDYQGDKIIGKVMKLNLKTVKLVTNTHEKWNVYYQHLFSVIDAEQNIIDVPTIEIY